MYEGLLSQKVINESYQSLIYMKDFIPEQSPLPGEGHLKHTRYDIVKKLFKYCSIHSFFFVMVSLLQHIVGRKTLLYSNITLKANSSVILSFDTGYESRHTDVYMQNLLSRIYGYLILYPFAAETFQSNLPRGKYAEA